MVFISCGRAVLSTPPWRQCCPCDSGLAFLGLGLRCVVASMSHCLATYQVQAGHSRGSDILPRFSQQGTGGRALSDVALPGFST